jgi:transcription antitermination factor NusG
LVDCEDEVFPFAASHCTVTDVTRALAAPTAYAEQLANGKWVAVWTRPRAEKAAAHVFARRAVPHWLPTLRVRRRWSDRWKDVELPLFPGYLFAQTESKAWPSILTVPGVLTVVKNGRNPAWISAERMVELRRAVDRVVLGEQEPEVIDDFEPGDRVRVVDGPMAGLIGVVREVRGRRRLLVGFEQIGRALSILIGAAKVERYEALAN